MVKDAYHQIERLRKLANLLYEFNFTVKNGLKKPFTKKDQLLVSEGMYKHAMNISNALETCVNHYEQLIDYNKESFDAALREANEKIVRLEKELTQLEMGGYAWK